MEVWIKFTCSCGAVNWCSNGDPSDQTVSDVGGIRCWKCRCIRYFNDDADVDDDVDEDELYGCIEDGKRKPA